MPHRYYFDEQHIHEWLTVSKTEKGVQEYFERYVYGVADFMDYLERVGGVRKLEELRRTEQLRLPAWSPEVAP